jgi:hypothetical protein
VQGGYEGRMESLGETIGLVAEDGTVISSITLPYATIYGVQGTEGGDMDADGDVDFDDILGFVDLIRVDNSLARPCNGVAPLPLGPLRVLPTMKEHHA